MSTVNPVQSTTYYLTGANNPITFGAGTRISAPNGQSAVRGDAASGLTMTNQGTLSGGYGGVYFSVSGTVLNVGAIKGTTTIPGYGGGVWLAAGGAVSNSGVISSVSNYGVGLYAGGTITNQSGGSISGGLVGVDLGSLSKGPGGGTVVNSGSISGTYDGILAVRGAASVVNNGVITGAKSGSMAGLLLGDGVALNAGGALVNHGNVGGARYGVYLDAPGTVTNFGSISGIKASVDLRLSSDRLIAEAGSDFAGVVKAGGGSLELAGGTGTITGLGSTGTLSGAVIMTFSGFGAYQVDAGAHWTLAGANALSAGVSLTTAGLVTVSGSLSGDIGIRATGAGTIVNAGTISGAGGSVKLSAAGERLVADAGAKFVGLASGAGGTLELASGTGTITGLGATATLSGSDSLTFSGFGAVVVDAGSSWTLAGANTLAAGQTLTSAGALTLAGTLAGAGTLAITGGTATVSGTAKLSVAKLSQSGASTVVVSAAALGYAGAWTQTAGKLQVGAGDRLSLSGANLFKGTLAGAGTVAITAGSDLLTGTTLSVAQLSITNATVTLAGTITNSGAIVAATPHLIVAAAGASLTGGGKLTLTNASTNLIKGASASATLRLVNGLIQGAGDIGGGQMKLVLQSGGRITGNQTTALILDTGANAVINAGTITSAGPGGVEVKSAIGNTGVLAVSAGILSLDGAVTGAGTAQISGGTLNAKAAFNENVGFTAAKGVLELARSYAGQISGFSKTGTTALVLEAVAFVAGKTKASYAGNTTSGVLTVTNGTVTSKITLIGDYTASAFTVSKDASGGTRIVDPATPATATSAAGGATTASVLPFVQAMAAVSDAVAPMARLSTETWRGAPALLALPAGRAALA